MYGVKTYRDNFHNKATIEAVHGKKECKYAHCKILGFQIIPNPKTSRFHKLSY